MRQFVRVDTERGRGDFAAACDSDPPTCINPTKRYIFDIPNQAKLRIGLGGNRKILNFRCVHVSRFPSVASERDSEILIGLIDMHGFWLSCLIIYESVMPYMICELVTKS